MPLNSNAAKKTNNTSKRPASVNAGASRPKKSTVGLRVTNNDTEQSFEYSSGIQESSPSKEYTPRKTEAFNPAAAKEAARERSLRNIKNETLSEEESIATIKEKHIEEKKKKKKGFFSNLFGNVARTAQDTIPFTAAYPNGIIETDPGFYTKTYLLEDVNFRVATKEDQESIFEHYEGFINSFDQNTKIEITINNRNIDEKVLENELMCNYQNDGIDYLRDELNDLILMRMHEGKNNLISEKYLTVGLAAEDIRAADNAFKSRIDSQVQDQMRIMLGRQSAHVPPMTITQRIKSLHDIYNIGNEAELPEDFDLDEYVRQGMGVKDILAPAAFKFHEDFFKFGDSYGRVMYCKALPTRLSTDFMAELADMPFNLTASIQFEPLEKSKAVDLVRRHLVTINGNVVDAQKKATKGGYSVSLIPQELRDAQQQGEYLMEDIRLNNQGLFFLTIVIAHYADSLEKLKEDTKMLSSLGSRYSCGIAKLSHQQEIGFTTALPLCMNKLYVKRLAKTESAALFIPFNSQEVLQPGGTFMGVNALSRNLIVLDKGSKQAKSPNSLILGASGSGKSVTAKFDILNTLLTKSADDSQIFIIDPEGEYVKMAEELSALGTTVVNIKPGSGVYLNPLDMDLKYGDDDGGDNPIVMKSDYITSLCEIALHSRNGLSSRQRSIIDRCVRELYKPYMKHMAGLSKDITMDVQASPTLDALYEMFREIGDPDADELAGAIEMFAKGSFDCFARTTNVNVNNRLVVYNIRDIGGNVKELGLQVCLNHIWNACIANATGRGFANGKTVKTYIYLDEMHLLTKSECAATFLQQIWKRCRKWGGYPTGLTQNLEDLLTNEAARAIINNSEFVTMLGQSPADRRGLQNLFGISNAQLTYITNTPPGQGLIFNGQTIVPFENKIPEDTEIFRLVTTKPENK